MDEIYAKINSLLNNIEDNIYYNNNLKNRINILFSKFKDNNNCSKKIIKKMYKIEEIINNIHKTSSVNKSLLSSIKKYSITRNAKDEFMKTVLLYNPNILKAKIIYKQYPELSFPTYKTFDFNSNLSLDNFLKELDFSYTEKLDFTTPYNSQALFGIVLCEDNVYFERGYSIEHKIGFNWERRQFPTLKSIEELIVI